MHRNLQQLLLAVMVATAVSACTREKPIPLSVPDGWENQGAYWWRTGTDTTGVFRDLETLLSMGISSEIGSTAAGAGSEQMARRRLITYVKESLIPLFRNQPDVVDSLFERYVVPRMADARLDGNVQPVVKQFKLEGYRTIARHFREPYSLTRMGSDIPVPIPDSLRDQSIVGRVFMQVYIAENGEPMAIRKLRGVHPVLDRIAIRAMTTMRWQPAYLLQSGKSKPIASWARFTVDFASVL